MPLRNIYATLDNSQLDAFSNHRIAAPSFVADGQLTYDLQPLIYEQIISANGTITHDATNRCANISLTAADNAEETYMQSYAYYRYQSGRAQEIFMTFAAYNLSANTQAFVEYGDGDNGIAFETDGTLLGSQFVIHSLTGNGDETVTSANWSLDKLDGTGPSKITIDPTKTQIVVIDVQALYVGRVRVGFDIDGLLIWVHEFNHANIIDVPYIQSANLPIRAGIRATNAAATGSMRFVCSCVLSRGGQEQIAGYDFTSEAVETAAADTRTHLMTIQPRTTFNGFENRVELVIEGFDLVVTGANPVKWELCIGQQLTTPSFTNVNTTYSSASIDLVGTLNGTPSVVAQGGYCAATSQVKGIASKNLINRYPITLNAAGAVRDMGQITIVVTGLGGASACRGILHWRELR